MTQLRSNIKESFGDLLKYFKILLGLLVVLYFFSGFYMVKQNEVAIVEQFGNITSSEVTSGINYTLPWPVSHVYYFSSKKQIKTVVIDHFARISTQKSEAQKFYIKTHLSPYCITGDNNIITIQYHIKYFISNPVEYFYQSREPEKILSVVARSIMVHYLGGIPVDKILTTGKQQIALQVKSQMQQTLNHLNTGISIDFVELKMIAPPEGAVQRAFNDVIKAKVEKQKSDQEASRYRDRIQSETKKEVLTMKQQGVLYRRTRVGEAQQEVTQFTKQLREYLRFPESHRRKLYMDRIYPRFKRVKRMIMVDPDRGDNLLRIEINYDTLRYLFSL